MPPKKASSSNNVANANNSAAPASSSTVAASKSSAPSSGSSKSNNNPVVTYDIETEFKNTKIPGFLTFENRIPLFDTVLPHKVRTLFPQCAFEYSIAGDGEVRPEVARVIPHGMILLFCSITGPQSLAAKAIASVEHAFGRNYWRSERELSEFFIDASAFDEKKLKGAMGNARKAPETLGMYVSFIRRKKTFFCSTYFLPEEEKTRPSVSAMKSAVLAFLTTSSVPSQQLRRGDNGAASSSAKNDVIYDDDDYKNHSDYASSSDDSDSASSSSSSSSSSDNGSDGEGDDDDAQSRASESSSDAEEERMELKRKADAAAKKNKKNIDSKGGRGAGAAAARVPSAFDDDKKGRGGSPTFKSSLIPYEEMQHLDHASPAQALESITRIVESLDQRGIAAQHPLQWYSFLYYCENAYCRHRLAQWEMPDVRFALHTQLADALLVRLPSDEEQNRLGIRFPPFSERRPSVGVGDTVVIHIPTEEMILEAPVYAVFPRELGIYANDEVRFSESSNIKFSTNRERPKQILLRVAKDKTPVHITFDSTPFGFRCAALSAAATRGDRAYDFFVNPTGAEVYPAPAPNLRELHASVPEKILKGTFTLIPRGELSRNQAAIVGFMCHPPRGRHELAINGPPGTGKTEVLARGILAILDKDPRARILVASTSHAAVDNLFTRCLFLSIDSNAKKFKDRQGRDSEFRKNFMRFYRSRKMPLSVPKHVLPFTNLFPMVAADELTETSKNMFDEDLAAQMIPTKRVIFTNITAVSKIRHWDKQQFTHVVIDEAQQAALVEGFLALEVLNTNHPTHQFIVAGDTEQIKPHVLFPKIRQWLEPSVLAVANKNTSRFLTMNLDESFRAGDDVAKVQSAIFYKGKLRAAINNSRHEQEADVKQLISTWTRKNMEGTNFPFQFIHIAGAETMGEADSSKAENIKERSAMTYSNPAEVACVANIVSSMLQSGIPPSSVVVLTNFKTQRKAIQSRLDMSHRKGVIRVTCLEEFQGQEADIIIISLVRNQRDDNFLNKDELNTILSRQKYIAIIIGDGNMVRGAGSKKWNQVMAVMTNPENHGAFNYDYETQQFLANSTYDLELSSQKHALNIKEFKPATNMQKSLLFKEYRREEILAQPSAYFVGRVRWFDASRLSSYVETSDQRRFLVARNRFTSAVDVKIDMQAGGGARRFFTIPGDIIALIVDGMEDRVAPLARSEIPTLAIQSQHHPCWPFAENYHFGSVYGKKAPWKIVLEASQRHNSSSSNTKNNTNNHQHKNNNNYMIHVPDEDVDIEIMTGSSYTIRDDDDDRTVFASQQPAGLPVCILRYAKLPPILCEVKMKVVNAGSSSNYAGAQSQQQQNRRYHWGEASPVDKRFPGLPFEHSQVAQAALLRPEEMMDSKVIRFWCELIRPPLNNTNGGFQQQPEQYDGSYNFYRPIKVERSISVTEEPDMHNIRLPSSTVHHQLPLCSPLELTGSNSPLSNPLVNANEVRFIHLKTTESHVGFSLTDPSSSSSSTSAAPSSPSQLQPLAPGSEFMSSPSTDLGGFGFGFSAGGADLTFGGAFGGAFGGVGGAAAFGDQTQQEQQQQQPQSQNGNSKNNNNNNSVNNVNNLTGHLRVGIHVPIVVDSNHESLLFQNGVTGAQYRPPVPSGAQVDVVSIYTDIYSRPGSRQFDCVGDTYFKVERLTNFQVSGTLQEGLKKLSRMVEDAMQANAGGSILNVRLRLSNPESIAAYFGDYRAALELCNVLPSQALLVRRHVRQNSSDGIELAQSEWYVPTLDIKESGNGQHRQCFVSIFGQNEDYDLFTMTRACQPYTSLGALVVQRQMMIVAKLRGATKTAVELDAAEKTFLRNSREMAAWLNALAFVRCADEDFE